MKKLSYFEHSQAGNVLKQAGDLLSDFGLMMFDWHWPYRSKRSKRIITLVRSIESQINELQAELESQLREDCTYPDSKLDRVYNGVINQSIPDHRVTANRKYWQSSAWFAQVTGQRMPLELTASNDESEVN